MEYDGEDEVMDDLDQEDEDESPDEAKEKARSEAEGDAGGEPQDEPQDEPKGAPNGVPKDEPQDLGKELPGAVAAEALPEGKDKGAADLDVKGVPETEVEKLSPKHAHGTKRRLSSLRAQEAMLAEFTEDGPAPSSATKDEERGTGMAARPSFTRASFTQLRAPKPCVENGRISFQGFQGADRGSFVNGKASVALTDGASLKRISFTQLRRDTYGDDDFGLGGGLRAGGAAGGAGSAWRNLRPQSLLIPPAGTPTGSDLAQPSSSSSAPAPAADGFIGTPPPLDREKGAFVPPARGTWQGTGAGKDPSSPLLVRSSIKRNTLRSLQREKIVGQTSLVSSMGETDPNLWANLPSIGKKVDASTSPPATPVNAVSAAGGDGATVTSAGPTVVHSPASTTQETPAATPQPAPAVSTGRMTSPEARDSGDAAAGATQLDTRGQDQQSSFKSSGGDEAFLQELSKVAMDDLDCELPKASFPKWRGSTVAAIQREDQESLVDQLEVAKQQAVTLESQRHTMAQALQSLKDRHEAEVARNQKLVDRVAALEADNQRLRAVSEESQKELAAIKRELQELRAKR